MFASGPRSAANAIRRPSGDHAGCDDVEVAAASAGAASAPRAERHQPQVRAADDVAGLVVAEVEAGDPARERRSALPLLPTMKRWSPACATSARPIAVGLQWTLDDAVLQRRSAATARRRRAAAPTPAATASSSPTGVPHERDVPAVGRDGRRAVANAAAGELARPAAAKRPQPQVRLVVVAPHPAQGVDDAPIRRGRRRNDSSATWARTRARGVAGQPRRIGGVCTDIRGRARNR